MLSLLSTALLCCLAAADAPRPVVREKLPEDSWGKALEDLRSSIHGAAPDAPPGASTGDGHTTTLREPAPGSIRLETLSATRTATPTGPEAQPRRLVSAAFFKPGQLEEHALLGDTAAQTVLGSMYYLGRETSGERNIALYWYRRAAESGHPVARFLLAGMLFLGEGAERDREQARAWYRAAANQGHQEARNLLRNFNDLEEAPLRERLLVLNSRLLEDPGLARYADTLHRATGRREEQDATPLEQVEDDAPEDIFELLLQEARMEYETGLGYELGIEQPEDLRLAAQWFQRAARKNYAPAQFKLGMAHLYGAGVSQDLEQSLMWLERAAMQDFSAAQRNLALELLLDEQPRSRIQAYAWFSIAGRRRNTSVDRRNLDDLATRMSGEELQQAQKVIHRILKALPADNVGRL